MNLSFATPFAFLSVASLSLALALAVAALAPPALAQVPAPSTPAAAVAPAEPIVALERLTHVELRDRIAAGTTVVLVPVGGTEQNGPHMVLGKHNVRVRVLAERIARQLGHAVVAPVLAYVPEGAVRPPAAHMRFSGTISIPEPAFEAVLEGTARSFRQHGLVTVVFLGDHGGYQRNLEHVAAKLNREWGAERTGGGGGAGATRPRAVALTAYYDAYHQVDEALRARGYTAAEIGTHAGLSDTALAMAADPSLVRPDLLKSAARREGVQGDPARASADLGQAGLQMIVDASVAAIRARMAAP
jgi:creatinine amidohydrolase/Fe(II)-dependent formamide hydrolase-like protein